VPEVILMLSVMDVAERYSVSRETVLSWILGGLLSATHVAPAGSKRKFWRVSEQALADFERTRTNGRAAPPRSPHLATKSYV
jgi:hypothetical protein